jgi:dTDP-glucose 4,6-dehydratase
MTRVIVTGGCGFIGSNFIRLLLEKYVNIEVVNIDKLTYAGNLDNVAEFADEPRYQFVRVDITQPEAVEQVLVQGADALVHFAAETHVDRSIHDAEPFLRTNVLGTTRLLDAARRHQIGRFVQVSSDEVYGSLGATGSFTEEAQLAPNSPYAASKAAADLLVRSYGHTYGVPAIITRCGNNYGPYQFPEKLIPLFICNLLNDEPVPVYGDGQQVRDWIHVRDHCTAIDMIRQHGRIGTIYNVGARCERTNLELTELLLDILHKPRSLIRFVADRPGHDRRYALDTTKLEKELGWRPAIAIEEGIRATVRWYEQHRPWVERIRCGEYLDYYQRQYGSRLI